MRFIEEYLLLILGIGFLTISGFSFANPNTAEFIGYVYVLIGSFSVIAHILVQKITRDNILAARATIEILIEGMKEDRKEVRSTLKRHQHEIAQMNLEVRRAKKAGHKQDE